MILALILIALGLASDSFRIAVSGGLSLKRAGMPVFLKVGLVFTLFYVLMAWGGWWLGEVITPMIKPPGPWIGSAVLVVLGGKLIWKGFYDQPEDHLFNINNLVVLIGIALANGFNALVAGLAINFGGWGVPRPLFIIGGLTLILAIAGIQTGYTYQCSKCGKKAVFAGGIVMIAGAALIFVNTLKF